MPRFLDSINRFKHKGNKTAGSHSVSPSPEGTARSDTDPGQIFSDISISGHARVHIGNSYETHQEFAAGTVHPSQAAEGPLVDLEGQLTLSNT